MKIKLITDIEEVRRSQKEWDEVAGAMPFFRFDWLVTWLTTQVEDVTPAVLVGCGSNDQWLGVAPFCVDAKASRFVRRLRFLGSGPTCSDYLRLFAKPEFERSFAECTTDWLDKNLRRGGPLGTIDVIEFEGIDPQDESTQYFCDLLDAAGFKSHTKPLEACWVTDLPESWPELNASFSKSMRRKTKKAVQRLADPDTEILSTKQASLSSLWPTFVDLHQKRRMMLGQAGCFAETGFEAFLKNSLEQLVPQDRADVLQINYQGIPLACAVMLNDGITSFLYQSGMEPEWVSREPGYQIVVAAIQESIHRGRRRFDFLRGDEPYKARWSTTRVPLISRRFIPRNFSSQLKHGIWSTGHSIKQHLRRSES